MLILRFSDYETSDTVREHSTVLEQTGEVWWGWWKKRHEVWPGADITQLATAAEAGGVTIGLLNRGEGKYYIATCVQVVHSKGVGLPAPDARMTPTYYSEKKCPAWFRIRDIREIELREWIERFRDVPAGDDTLFRAGNRLSVQTYRAVSRGAGVLHISDLHFGSDHAYLNGRAGQARVDLVSAISERVGSPAALVVSGDLTTEGQADGLTSARMFIERLAEALDLARDAVIIAPGNHDILLDDPKVTRDFSNEQQFRDLVELFYGRPTSLERVHRIEGGDGVTYVIGAVNSSRPRSVKTMAYGYVGADRSEPVARTIFELSSEVGGPARVWTGLVLHHHVLPSPHFESVEDDRPVGLALDAGELVSIAQEYGLDALLHGHQHLPFVGEVRRLAECNMTARVPERSLPVTVLGAGSAGASRLPNELRNNSFGYYLPSPDGLGVRVWELNPGRVPQEMWNFVISRRSLH